MKMIVSAVLCASVLTVLAAETVLNAGFSAQKWSKASEWNFTNDSAQAVQTPGKYPGLSTAVPLEADAFYELTFDYRTSGAKDPGDALLCHCSGNGFRFPPVTGWTQGKGYFHNGEKKNGKLLFQLTGKSAYRLELRNVVLKKLAPSDLKRIPVDFEKDGGPMPAFFRKHDWNGVTGSLEVVEAEDHISGGKAMKVSLRSGEKRNAAVYSLVLPLEPEKKYSLSFWAKARTQTSLRFGIDGYIRGYRHWYRQRTVSVEAGWRKYALEFSGPSLAEFPGMAKRTAYLNFGLSAQEENTVLIKDIVLEQRGK